MATSLFDNAPEYDSDLDTLADFVIEPTTVHVPPPPSPAPNTCLCGRTTRDDDVDEPLYCSEICARLDAFHALTARSRSNSLAPTPVTTAPATPLGAHMPLRESIAGLFARDSFSTPPFLPTPLSECSSFASIDSSGLPIEMSSHYRRVHAKRERMERRASEERERSRSHSRSHSKASPSLEGLEEECHVETHIEREAGSDGEDHIPTPATVLVHVAVNVQVVHQERNDDDHSEPSLGPAPGVEWHDPFADPMSQSPSHEPPVAPHDASDPSLEADVLSITESELVGDLSPFVAYAPVSAPPPGLRTRKSSVCFAGVGAAGRMELTRSRAPSDARSRSASVTALAEKPLPPTPGHDHTLLALERDSVVEVSAESLELVIPLPSPALTMDLPSPKPSVPLESAEPTTPTSSTAPASPRTPNARIHGPEADPLATPSRSSSAPAPDTRVSPTLRRSPAARPATSLRAHKPDALDTLARAKIFSMVIDPELDVFATEILDQASAPPLKRSDTAPELTAGWGPAWTPPTPRKATRARADSTPRLPGAAGRARTTSTPAHPGMLQLVPRTPRRARVQVPPPTPPVSPAHVSSPRPPVGQDPGSWPSFGAVLDAWNGEGLHRRQESGESSGSSATDVSWESSSGAPLSSVCSWPTPGDETTDSWPMLRARSPATSSVRTVVPPPRGSSLGSENEKEDHVHLHLCKTRRSRRHSSIAALDSILAMEDNFWATEAVVVREVEECVDGAVGVGQFAGDAGGFSFPSEKTKAAFAPVLRIAGLSRPPSMANVDAPSRRGSVRFDESTEHRAPVSQFPASPSVGSLRSSAEGDASLAPPYLSGGLFDAPMTSSPLSGSPALSRYSPALPNASPISTHFGLRTPSSPYLSVPSRRGSRSADASSVLLRTASAARLAVALNAAPDDDDYGHDESPYIRYSPGGTRVRRSGSLGHSSPLGLGLALGVDEYSRARANSESWTSPMAASVASPVSGTMSRSGSRMNLMNPTTSVVEEEEEEEEDYGQVVDGSKFAGIAASPTVPSMEQSDEASPLIDAFPHPMGGYFPGSRFVSRANTPVRGLHGSNSALSLRQVAMGATSKDTPEAESEDEDEEIVTTVQRMRQSMQLLTAA